MIGLTFQTDKVIMFKLEKIKIVNKVIPTTSLKSTKMTFKK